MKNTIIPAAFLLMIALSNGSIATINQSESGIPVPEVVACESTNNCEMTRLNELYSSE